MALPRIDLPSYQITLPVSKQQVTFRAYTAREEKLMLMAVEAGEQEQLPHAIRQIITNCTGIKDPDSLCLADKEYILIQMRSKVNGQLEELEYICKLLVNEKECGGSISVEVDLNSLTVDTVPSGKIKLTKDIGIELTIPSVKSQREVENMDVKFDVERKIALIYKSLVSIFSSEGVTFKQDITFDEFEDWLLSLPSAQNKMIMDFIKTIPSIVFKTEVKCSKCGALHSINLEGVDDFFTY